MKKEKTSTKVIICVEADKDAKDIQSYIDKLRNDYTFLKMGEAVELANCGLVKSKRDEYMKQLAALLDEDVVSNIASLFHSVMNGYENALYEALVNYLTEGTRAEFDSRLLNRILEKGVKIAEA